LQRRRAILVEPSNPNTAIGLVRYREADVMRWMATVDRYDLMLAVAVFFFVLTITLALV
jgi:hypothetical protein